MSTILIGLGGGFVITTLLIALGESPGVPRVAGRPHEMKAPHLDGRLVRHGLPARPGRPGAGRPPKARAVVEGPAARYRVRRLSSPAAGPA